MPTGPFVLNIRARPIWGDVQARTQDGLSVHQVGKRDLARYYRLLADEVARLDFTEEEIALLGSALAGQDYSERTYLGLWVDVKRYCDAHALWGTHGADLIVKLQSLPPGEVMAIVDAIERWQTGGRVGRWINAGGRE